MPLLPLADCVTCVIWILYRSWKYRVNINDIRLLAMYRSHAHRMMMHKNHSIFTSFSFSSLFFPFWKGDFRMIRNGMGKGPPGNDGICMVTNRVRTNDKDNGFDIYFISFRGQRANNLSASEKQWTYVTWMTISLHFVDECDCLIVQPDLNQNRKLLFQLDNCLQIKKFDQELIYDKWKWSNWIVCY